MTLTLKARVRGVIDHGCGGPDYEPPCATSGTLVLSSLPESDEDLPGLSGDLEAVFADGWTIAGAFRVP